MLLLARCRRTARDFAAEIGRRDARAGRACSVPLWLGAFDVAYAVGYWTERERKIEREVLDDAQATVHRFARLSAEKQRDLLRS